MSHVFIGVSVSLLAMGCTCNPPNVGPSGGLPIDPAPAPVGGFGSWLSMDASADGAQLTIAYYDTVATAAGFAVGLPNENGTVTWAHERVEGQPLPSGIDTADVGKYTTHRTAPDGTTWLAYQDVRNGTLRAAQRTGVRVWGSPVEVDAGGEWSDLAIDAAGNPVVVHCEPERSEVRLARFDGTRWINTTLYTGARAGERAAGVSHTRILIDEAGEHVAFRDDAKQGLVLIDLGAGAPAITDVDPEGDVGAWPSLAREGDALVIAYHDVGNQDLRLTTRSAEGTWRRSVIDDGQLRGADTEVFVRDGTLSVAYFDGLNNDLLLAERDTEGWALRQVGSEGAMGYHNEVAFASGQWWAGTYDHAARTLFVRAL